MKSFYKYGRIQRAHIISILRCAGECKKALGDSSYIKLKDDDYCMIDCKNNFFYRESYSCLIIDRDALMIVQ